MKCSFLIPRFKPSFPFSIAGLMLTIAPLCLMLAAANTSAQAQTSDAASNAAVAPSPADWTQFLRDNMQRWNPYETVLGVGNVGALKVKWKSPVGTSQVSSPVVVNGVAYASSTGGDIVAVNASTGAKLWSTNIPNIDGLSPAVENGVFYIGSSDGHVYALNARTGAKLWSYATSGFPVTSSPAVANGVVYVGSDNEGSAPGNEFFALNASTGALIWSFSGVGPPTKFSSPAVANGIVYVGATDLLDRTYELSAMNASTGGPLWSFQGLGSFGPPAVANGVVYVGSQDDNLYALNATTGVKLWSYTTGGGLFGAPAVANGIVYVGSTDGSLYALNASTGAKVWSYGGVSDGSSSPAVANGVVYIEAGGSLYALNASTGAKLWSYSIGLSSSSPAIVNGVLYVGGQDTTTGEGDLYAFSVGADLYLRIQPTPTAVHQGDLLTYAFPVWNLGPGNAVHEVLSTQVPAGTTFDYIRISGSPGVGTCTTPRYQGTGSIVCHENSSMAPNTTWTVRLTVRVTASSGTVITENAAGSADTTDPNMANNTATVSTKVQ